MTVSGGLLFKQTTSLASAVVLMCFGIAGCAARRAGSDDPATDPTRQASALLVEARDAADISTRIGLQLAAADKASQGIAEGNIRGARTLYNAACAEVAVWLRKASSAPALPTTFRTPAGAYTF